MKSLSIGSGLDLPAEAVTQTFGVLAKRRADKSYLARRFAEQLLGAHLQVVVVDPKGDWWGIRSSANGRGPGLPVVILGGERGDAPLESTGGELVAKLVVQEQISALLDLSLFRKHEVATFMTAFLETLYRLKAREQYRTPVMLIVDEADAIAPQRPMKGEERMLGAAEDLVRRGGQRGIGCMLVTQRSAVLNKNVLTQVQVLMGLRTIAPQDLAALNAWIDVHGTPEQQKTLMASLPSLPVGDAWVWSPGWPTDRGIFKRVHVLPIQTFDSGATPRPGEKRSDPKRLADIDLEALRRQMAATLDRSRANDPRELRRRIAELERQIRARPGPEVVPKTVEVPVLSEKMVGRVEKAILDHARVWLKMLEASDRAQAAVKTIQQTIASVRRLPGPAPPAPPIPFRPRTDPPRPPLSHPQENGCLRSGARRMLQVLAQFKDRGGLTRDQLALLSGYTRSGTYDTYVGTLRRLSFCEMGGGRLRVTDRGLQELGSEALPPPATSSELVELFSRKLRTGERRMLQVILDVYPAGITADDLATRSGYTRSGTFDTYLGKLRRNLLVVREGGFLMASETLFMGVGK